MYQSLNTPGSTAQPIQVEISNIGARGCLSPILFLWAAFRTTEGWTADLLYIRLRIMCRDELVGEGAVIGTPITHASERTELFEIPVTHRMMQHVTDTLGSAHAVDLQLRWSGMVRLRLNPGAQKRFAADPEPGESVELQVHDSGPMNFQIARSDWYTKVLSPTRQEDYVYLEIAVPRGTAATAWRNSLALLIKAEEAYAKGDDASAFTHLRGIIDALPGAKKHIFDALPEPKRGKIDDLLKSYGEYLHAGRHVAATGPTPGTFPVDHIDTAFAIAACKILLSYASLTLTRST
jgi:hypothetical protein